ncbi:MAG: hypothetical protein R3F18_11525 [Lysobacterales bacterium]
MAYGQRFRYAFSPGSGACRANEAFGQNDAQMVEGILGQHNRIQVKLRNPMRPNWIFEAATSRGWRECYRIIFGHSRQGDERLFDVAWIVLILFSVLIAMLDSVAEYDRDWGQWLRAVEARPFCSRSSTQVRLAVVRHPALCAQLRRLTCWPCCRPTSVWSRRQASSVGAQHLIVIRVLRILRVRPILKLFQYVGEASMAAACAVPQPAQGAGLL